MRIPDYVDLILFDLDGLLVDTERLHWQAYQRMCRVFGCTLSWDLPTYLAIAGGSATGICERMRIEIPELFHGREWDELYAVKREQFYALVQSSVIHLMPGAALCLHKLSTTGIPRVVVTHSSQRFVEIVRSAHPIFSTITHWVAREQYRQPKPAPDGYRTACRDTGVVPERAIGFEDTMRGVQSLIAAQIHAVLVGNPDFDTKIACEQQGVAIISSLSCIQRPRQRCLQRSLSKARH
jgi:HAD superfamily hydrolase (TIGR01509 family)